MAGVTVPTIFLLFVFATFLRLRFAYDPAFPLERVAMFPLALVPVLWGLWNVLFRSLQGRRWVPLGVHGALLPALLVPVALFVSGHMRIDFPVDVRRIILEGAPLLMILYYLVWKYLVGFLNRLVGLA